MNIKPLTLCLGGLLSLPVLPVLAQEAAHVHGIAQAQVALDGRDLLVYLQIPAADLLGFEHAPQTAAQRQQVEGLQQQWADTSRWLHLDPAAQCGVTGLQVQLGDDEAGHGGHHHDHDHDDHHHHDDHGHGEAHLDGRITLSMQCAAPQLLKSLELNPFALLPDLQQVRYQSVWPSGQSAGSLSVGATRIEFKSP